MSTRFLARDREERDQVIGTIGPFWDGNEVWLITAGGAMFASFPNWYAAVFSGYYLILFAILFGLIIRGVSFNSVIKWQLKKVVISGIGRYSSGVLSHHFSLVFYLLVW